MIFRFVFEEDHSVEEMHRSKSLKAARVRINAPGREYLRGEVVGLV